MLRRILFHEAVNQPHPTGDESGIAVGGFCALILIARDNSTGLVSPHRPELGISQPFAISTDLGFPFSIAAELPKGAALSSAFE